MNALPLIAILKIDNTHFRINYTIKKGSNAFDTYSILNYFLVLQAIYH